MSTLKNCLVQLLVAVLTMTGYTQAVQAAMVDSRQAYSAQQAQADRDRIAANLARPEVASRLSELGVAPSDVQARVDAMSDTEVAQLAERMDSLPAGGDSFIGAVVFIFLLLLVTDILGLTKVFPFTRSTRR